MQLEPKIRGMLLFTGERAMKLGWEHVQRELNIERRCLPGSWASNNKTSPGENSTRNSQGIEAMLETSINTRIATVHAMIMVTTKSTTLTWIKSITIIQENSSSQSASRSGRDWTRYWWLAGYWHKLSLSFHIVNLDWLCSLSNNDSVLIYQSLCTRLRSIISIYDVSFFHCFVSHSAHDFLIFLRL